VNYSNEPGQQAEAQHAAEMALAFPYELKQAECMAAYFKSRHASATFAMLWVARKIISNTT